MSRVTAPLLSFGAGGQIGKSMVFSKWRGIPYVRRHVIPANPRTAAQTLTRKTFALLREMFKAAPAAARAPWTAFATGRPFLDFNKYVGENVRVLRGDMDMADFIASPGANGGPPAVDVTFAPGALAGEIDVTFVIGDAPEGYTLNSIVGTAFHNQAPDGIFEGPYAAVTEPAPATDLTIAGLGAGAECVVSGFLVWNKPDGRLAYSVGVTSIQAAHA